MRFLSEAITTCQEDSFECVRYGDTNPYVWAHYEVVIFKRPGLKNSRGMDSIGRDCRVAWRQVSCQFGIPRRETVNLFRAFLATDFSNDFWITKLRPASNDDCIHRTIGHLYHFPGFSSRKNPLMYRPVKSFPLTRSKISPRHAEQSELYIYIHICTKRPKFLLLLFIRYFIEAVTDCRSSLLR